MTAATLPTRAGRRSPVALDPDAILRAREDPATFVEYCFTDAAGVFLHQSRVHRELHRFLTARRKALVEMPRDHGKSVQVCARVVWELGHNPGLRVKVVCATDQLAAERGRFLRAAVAANPFVRSVFPHLTPGRPWAAHEFAVARPSNAIGPSVAAFGVGAGSTGARADLLVCDDIVDVRCLYGKADRDRVAEYFFNNLLNLLEPDGRCWNLCTPWHVDDLNARLKRSGGFAVFRRAVRSNLTPVWPEKWTRERLQERQAEIGPAAFARGYRLRPIDESEVAVRAEWVKFWADERPRHAFAAVVLAVDPAVTARARADASALVVLGRLADATEIRVLEAVARRVPAPELVEGIDDADRRWQPDVILFESNAAFAGLRDLMCRHARFGPKVCGEAQSRGKPARVAALAVPVRNGTVRLRGDGAGGVDPGQRELFDELCAFPFAPHDDLIDATAAGVAHLIGRPEPRVWV